MRMRLLGRLLCFTKAMYKQNATVFEVAGSPVAAVGVASGIRQGMPTQRVAVRARTRSIDQAGSWRMACLQRWGFSRMRAIWRPSWADSDMSSRIFWKCVGDGRGSLDFGSSRRSLSPANTVVSVSTRIAGSLVAPCIGDSATWHVQGEAETSAVQHTTVLTTRSRPFALPRRLGSARTGSIPGCPTDRRRNLRRDCAAVAESVDLSFEGKRSADLMARVVRNQAAFSWAHGARAADAFGICARRSCCAL